MMNTKTSIRFAISILFLGLVLGCAAFFIIKRKFETLDQKIATGLSSLEISYAHRLDLIPEIRKSGEKQLGTTATALVPLTVAEDYGRRVELKSLQDMNSFMVAQKQVTSAIFTAIKAIQKSANGAKNQSILDLAKKVEVSENRIALSSQNLKKTIRLRNQFMNRFPYSWVARSLKLPAVDEL